VTSGEVKVGVVRSVVLYHKNCPDGTMAAAVAILKLRQLGEVVAHPVSYHRPIEEVMEEVNLAGAYVFVVDFSYSPRELDRLAKVAESVVVLDHHKSAIEKLTGSSTWEDGEGLVQYVENLRVKCDDDRTFRTWSPPKNVELVLDATHSGAVIAWHHFYPGAVLPWILERVQDYDLWRHLFPDSKAVHAFLRSHDLLRPEDFVRFLGQYQMASSMFPNDVLLEGAAILRANQRQVDILTANAQPVELHGLHAFAVNSPVHPDDIGAALAAGCADGVGVVWHWTGKSYKVCLRSCSVDGRPAVDVSAIARKYDGGGGHHHSAAFLCDELPWTRKV
jgi:hypothetical protein